MSDRFEAQKKKKWKTALCNSGEACWCRLIVTEDWNDLHEDDNECVIGDAAVTLKEAEYLIDLHNRALESEKE